MFETANISTGPSVLWRVFWFVFPGLSMRVFGYVRVGLGMRVFNSGDSNEWETNGIYDEGWRSFSLSFSSDDRAEKPMEPFPFQVMNRQSVMKGWPGRTVSPWAAIGGRLHGEDEPVFPSQLYKNIYMPYLCPDPVRETISGQRKTHVSERGTASASWESQIKISDLPSRSVHGI